MGYFKTAVFNRFLHKITKNLGKILKLLLISFIISIAISLPIYAKKDINNSIESNISIVDKNDTNSTIISTIIFTIRLIDRNISKQSTDTKNPQEIYTNIQKLAITNHLMEAITKAKKATLKYPDNALLNSLYAKLLFWNKEPSKAKKIMDNYKDFNKKLYKKIYISWAIDKLKSKKSTNSKLHFIYDLEPFAKNDYDILWTRIELNIKRKHLKTALTVTKKLVKKYPKSIEAHERLATLLFWNRRYYKSLRYYRKMAKRYKKSYKKEIHRLRHIIYLKKRLREKRRLARKYKKRAIKKSIRRAIIHIKKAIIQSRNSRISRKHMLGIGYTRAKYSDRRYEDYTHYIEATLDISNKPLYLRISRTSRYGLTDTKIEGEFYPTLPKPYWGYFNFSYTPNDKFFSKYSLGWHQYYSYKSWQFGAGYTYSKYKRASIQLLSSEYSYYFTDLLYAKQSLRYIPSNKSWAILNQVKKESTKKTLGWYMNFTIANSNEYIENSNILRGTSSKSLEIGLEYPIKDNFTIGTNIDKSWFKAKYNKYTRTNGEIFLRYYW